MSTLCALFMFISYDLFFQKQSLKEEGRIIVFSCPIVDLKFIRSVHQPRLIVPIPTNDPPSKDDEYI